jgi:pyruvate dehydrogenase E2 component (dihydrolipoamide acetyltransferase)
MSGEIRVPRLGWSMDEGTFVQWLKRDGETVAPGDPLFVLEGDKSAQDIEAIDAGVLRWLPDGPKPGELVKVGQLIGRLEPAGSVADASGDGPEMPPAVAEPAAPAPVVRTAQAASQGPVEIGRASETVASSPRARRVARELGVDWKGVRGTGRGGRVRERDVRAAVPATSRAVDTAVPITATRRTIGDRMLASLRTTAPVTLTTRADASNLVRLRNQFKATAATADAIVPDYHDLVIKLLARVLADHPGLNARREGDRIVRLSDVHIGIAVDTDAGLFVPVIRDVTRLSVRQVAAQSRERVRKARERGLSADDQRGGTFTVTNLGMYGIEAFTPIINPPETAILGLGAIRREPVCLADGRVVPGDVMTLSLTFDHCVVDGGPAARFLHDLAHGLENIAALLVE